MYNPGLDIHAVLLANDNISWTENVCLTILPIILGKIKTKYLEQLDKNLLYCNTESTIFLLRGVLAN